MNRRKFCSSMVAATALSTYGVEVAGALRPREAATLTATGRYPLIFDSRFPASRLVGAEAANRGLAATPFDGDVTALWFHELGPRWATSRAPVAGITTPATLFCLEQMARDAWMRVTIRAEHASSAAVSCAHRVTGPAADVARVCAALDAGGAWPARLAAALTEPSPDYRRRAPQRQAAIAGDWARDGHTATLVSWTITA